MKLFIDERREEIIRDDVTRIPLYSPEGFKILSDLWLKVGWDQKYLYSFTWLGRPVIQLPDDMLRMQEVIYRVKPDVVVETGVAHGGSLVFYASVCKAIGKGRVIGVDIEIRPHNRAAIQRHELRDLISLVEGDSVSMGTFERVRGFLAEDETVVVILDSKHSYEHVSRELDLYSGLVSLGSYIVATDGSQEYLHVTPRAQRDYAQWKEWRVDNPKRAAEDFAKRNPAFTLVEPQWLFNEGRIDFRVTYWPAAFLQRVR